MVRIFGWGNKIEPPKTLEDFGKLVSSLNLVSTGGDRLKNLVNPWKKLADQDQQKIALAFCSTVEAKKGFDIENKELNNTDAMRTSDKASLITGKDSDRNKAEGLSLEATIVDGLVKLGITPSSRDDAPGVVCVESKTDLFSRIKTLFPWHKKSTDELKAELKSLIEAKRSVAQVSGSESGILGRIASAFQFVFSRGSRPEDKAQFVDSNSQNGLEGSSVEVDRGAGESTVSKEWERQVDAFFSRLANSPTYLKEFGQIYRHESSSRNEQIFLIDKITERSNATGVNQIEKDKLNKLSEIVSPTVDL
jgi:hypothetical protein